MKKASFVCVILIAFTVYADEQATTDSGLRVLLREDGTWSYIEVPEVATKWSVSVNTDPLDDSRVVTYLLKADSGQSSWGKPIYLVIRDTEGEFELYISWKEYLGSEITVTHRVDDEPAVTQQWSISTNSQSSFYPSRSNPTLSQLILQLLESQQFVSRCTPYGENPTTAIFDIRGLGQIMAEYGSTAPKE